MSNCACKPMSVIFLKVLNVSISFIGIINRIKTYHVSLKTKQNKQQNITFLKFSFLFDEIQPVVSNTYFEVIKKYWFSLEKTKII